LVIIQTPAVNFVVLSPAGLHELVPSAATIATLVNPNNPSSVGQLRDMRHAAARAGVQLAVLTAKSEADFEAAFSNLVEHRIRALIVSADPSSTAEGNNWSHWQPAMLFQRSMNGGSSRRQAD
jgi:DNA-binding LacI/PurR family transcriptional regulator